jgi:3-hydroxyisobutyrate dehydrogenase-like beta-hydroxyacid dehydrogenase
MARNLIQAGVKLRVYNRTASKTAELVALGAAAATTPAETVTPGGIVITMLANDQAVEEVVRGPRGIGERLDNGGVHLSISTISPALARRLAELHHRSDAAYVAAPVFGRPAAAAARKLWICVSGPPAAKARVAPLLRILGQATYDLGDDAAAAHMMKLAGNFLIFSMIESLAEALALAEKSGLSRADVLNVLTQSLFNCPLYHTYGRLLTVQDYAKPGFRLALALKDLNLLRDTAEKSGTPMPVASLLHERMSSAVARGRGEWDLCAMALGAEEDAGLEPASKERAL